MTTMLINLLTLTIFGLIFAEVESMRFELMSGHTKCITEEIKSSAMTVGKYNVVSNNDIPVPENHKLTVRVTSPYGNNYHHADQVDSGQFAFTAPEAGDYTACFQVPTHKPQIPVTIEFEWRTGLAAKDWSKVAKKGKIDEMEIELKKLYDTVSSIHEEMFNLREREEEMQELNRSTSSQMGSLSLLSLMVCFSVAGMQFWHLKSYFERKKLL